MAVNTLGFVQAMDFGNPKVIQGCAMEVISGGQVVGCSGTVDAVSSGLNSFSASDVQLIVSADAENAIGVAMNNVASGAKVAALVDGVCLMRCIGSVYAGRLVKAVASEDAVANLGSQVVPANAEDASIAGNIFGRAYTAGASGNYALIHVKA